MKVDYVSLDALTEGVGASQVLPYAERLAARGLHVVLHTFEKQTPAQELLQRLRTAGVDWRPLAFGAHGAKGGLSRVMRAAVAVRRADLVHARSDVAAAATLLARPQRWLWDMRSFWREQRMELGMLSPGAPEERAFRVVERRAARSADAVITLASAAIPVLAARHGAGVAARCTVVPTCVDLDRFRPSEMPTRGTVFLLAGTLNNYYDVPTMVRLVRRAQALDPRTQLDVLSPDAGQWHAELRSVAARISAVPPAAMPAQVARSTVGLSVCRTDLGVSLTAAMPTKIAEFLASGRPVVVSRGIGDLDDLLLRYDCGVVLASSSDESLDAGLVDLDRLLHDSELPARCRRLAQEHFDVEGACDRLVRIYSSLF